MVLTTEAALRVAQELNKNYHLAIGEMRTIGLSHSAAEKFAHFLFEQISDGEKQGGEVRANLTLTHEEIAQMIGSSRETVKRLFSDFKKKPNPSSQRLDGYRSRPCSASQTGRRLSSLPQQAFRVRQAADTAGIQKNKEVPAPE